MQVGLLVTAVTSVLCGRAFGFVSVFTEADFPQQIPVFAVIYSHKLIYLNQAHKQIIGKSKHIQFFPLVGQKSAEMS